MPRKRLPREIWQEIRVAVWERDKHSCIHCGEPVSLKECHIDHRVSGKLGTNNVSNLRTLCYKCHALRLDRRHRGMIANALRKGIIPANWRELVWDDE